MNAKQHAANFLLSETFAKSRVFFVSMQFRVYL